MKFKSYNRILILSMETYINDLNIIFNQYNVCSSHGIDHAIAVLKHSNLAIKYHKQPITPNQALAIKLASLLHDADDRKFFPYNTDYENLRFVLRHKSDELVDLVIRMVELVSSSKNADNVPDDVKGREWMLIPRYCDRIEAIGMIGIERCYQYNKTTKAKLYLDTTPRPKSEDEIWKIATKERYNSYRGKSESMMDHYYDKLLRLGLFEIDNDYLINESRRRNQPIIDFVLYFSDLDVMSDDHVINFINSNK